jgi:hypothetical protein
VIDDMGGLDGGDGDLKVYDGGEYDGGDIERSERLGTNGLEPEDPDKINDGDDGGVDFVDLPDDNGLATDAPTEPPDIEIP